MTVFHLWYLRCEGNVLYFFPTYVKVILGWFPNKENIFKQLQCKNILGMDREIVFVFKELEIWSIISWTIHTCKDFTIYKVLLHSLSLLSFIIPWKEGERYHFHPLGVHFSHSVMSNSLQCHGMHQTRLPCPSPTPGDYPNSCPSSK